MTGVRFAHSPGRFAQDKEDEFPFVKAAAARVAAADPSTRQYRVVLIGDSAIEEALTSPRDLQRRIEKKCGRKVLVTPLLAGGMNQFEAADLCGLMQDRLHGQVVLQISPYHLSLMPTIEAYHKAVQCVGVDSSEMADALSLAGLPRPHLWGNFFLRNHEFLLARTSAFTRLLKPIPEPRAHLRPKERDPGNQRFQRDAEHTYIDTKGMRTKAIPNVAVYQRIIQPLRERGISVALLESPMNPRLASYNGVDGRGINPSDRRAYHELRAQLAADTGAALWDLSARTRLVSKDFADYIHIERDTARVRFTQALANRIAANVPRRKHKEVV